MGQLHASMAVALTDQEGAAAVSAAWTGVLGDLCHSVAAATSSTQKRSLWRISPSGVAAMTPLPRGRVVREAADDGRVGGRYAPSSEKSMRPSLASGRPRDRVNELADLQHVPRDVAVALRPAVAVELPMRADLVDEVQVQVRHHQLVLVPATLGQDL